MRMGRVSEWELYTNGSRKGTSGCCEKHRKIGQSRCLRVLEEELWGALLCVGENVPSEWTALLVKAIHNKAGPFERKAVVNLEKQAYVVKQLTTLVCDTLKKREKCLRFNPGKIPKQEDGII